MAINLNVTRADSSEYDAQLLLGIKGDPGKSAYEYAVDAGYTGTETDFTLLMESLEEFQDVTATAETLDAGESATASFSDGELSLGIPKGYSAGFGTVSATVDANHGVPAVTVTASGEDTAKNFAFAFSNLQPAPYDDSVIQARMDSFTNLEEGSTTGDAELIDGRVGADGVTYTNIGDAIRGQVTDLKSDLSDIRKTEGNLVDASLIEEGKAVRASDGYVVTASGCFVTGLIRVVDAKSIYVYNGIYQTSYYGHEFYTLEWGILSSVPCTENIKTRIIEVPEGAAYFRASGYAADKNSIQVGVVEWKEKEPVGVTPTLYAENVSPTDGTALLDYSQILVGTKLYYEIEDVAGKYGYLTVVKEDGTLTYYGKTSSSWSEKLYKGEFVIPSGFARLRWNTNSASNKLLYLGTTERTDETEEIKATEIYTKPTYNINSYALQSDGYRPQSISYGFSARNIYLPKGCTIKASVKDHFWMMVCTYDEYGVFINTTYYENRYTYTATADMWVSISIFAYDQSVTYDNDYEEVSELKIVTSYQPTLEENCGALLSRTMIYPDTDERYCRIPMVEVMPNKKVLCLFDSRSSLSDNSDQYIAYQIINSQNAVEKSGLLEPKDDNVYRQNESMSFTLPNGNIGVFFTNVLDDDEGESELRYIISEDYGNTWGSSAVIDATATGKQVFVAPSTKPIFLNESIMLIPIWQRDKDDRDGSTFQSGIMRFNIQNLTHSEKYVPTGNKTNECNIWLNDDGTDVILSCRRELSSSRLYYKIDVALSGSFTELSHFMDASSWMRLVCQEGTFQVGDRLFNTRHRRESSSSVRNELSLFCSDCLGRRYTQIIDLSNGSVNEGYSCIDISDNVIYVLSEGADKVIPTGKCMFLDKIIVND